MALKKLTTNTKNVKEVFAFIGNAFAFQTSLKLHHWAITGHASYARHIAIDQAIDDLSETLDSVAETAIALYGNEPINVPAATNPQDIIQYCETFYKEQVSEAYNVVSESFQTSILDDYAQGVQQLLYRLKRLS